MAIKIERWIEKSGIDYYISFIKAWIPFNAWYMSEYYDEDTNITTDKKILDKIKDEPNIFKSKIISLITASGDEAQEFRMHLHHLQKSLEIHPLSKGSNLSFGCICISQNKTDTFTHKYRTKTYKGVFDSKKARGSNRFSVEAMRKDGTTIVKIEIPDCKPDTLTSHPDFVKCKDEDKEFLKRCLMEVFPKKPISVLSAKAKKGMHIHADLYMVNDPNLIAKAIITMLYELRCKLFHGELDPTGSNSSTYRHAYHMLLLLINELK